MISSTPIPATPMLFGANISSGIPNVKPFSRIELPESASDRFQKHLTHFRHLSPVLAARIAAYTTLTEMEVPVYVNSLVYRLAEVKNEQAVVVPCNALLTAKQITSARLLHKAQLISEHWKDPNIYVKDNTWFIGDFAVSIDETGAYYHDIGGTNRRINNLAVACHDFRGVGYDVDEIALLDSVSSFYCWLSMYLPYSSNNQARVLDLANLIMKMPMDGREDVVSYPQEEMIDYSRLLWKTMKWTAESYPTGKDKSLYLPETFRSKEMVEPLHHMGLIPVVKGGVDFVPIEIGAVRQEDGLCLLSSKASKFIKRLVMSWGVVCEVIGQQQGRFRQVWQHFGMRYITTAAILPSHIAAPGVAWDLGSGLTISNPKWALAYSGELYDDTKELQDLVELFGNAEVTQQDNWFVIECSQQVAKDELVALVHGKTCKIPLKAHTSGELTKVRWRLDCRYRHIKQTNLVVEICIVETSNEWKARSGPFKAMMVSKPHETILGRHNAQVAFLKDTIKAFDSAVDLLEICAETFSRMPAGSKYRSALKEANQLLGIDNDEYLVFDAEIAITGGYSKLLELLEDWKRPVTTRELVCEDTARFIRQFLNLHTAYEGWVLVGEDHWRKQELEVQIKCENGDLVLYQTGLGYISTPELPLYMGQKAEHVPVSECVGIGNVLPNVLLNLNEASAFKLYQKHADSAAAYCNAMLSCLKGLPAVGNMVELQPEYFSGASPSELFEVACELGDYIKVEGRDYPIRLIRKYLGKYDYGCQYTLSRVLGDYLFSEINDHSERRKLNLMHLSQSASRLLNTVANMDRLRKVVTCCVPAVNAKTVALPEIPINEVWVRYSTHPSSVYQHILRAFGNLPEVVGIYRSPMITAAFYRLVVKHDIIDQHVFGLNWMAAYFDQGDHDGDGRTMFDATDLDVELATFDGMVNFIERCLGINLLSIEGLANGPKDLFIDHFEWLDHSQVSKKRGIKPSNYKTDADLIQFNKGAYQLYSEGVGICYHLCNYPLVIKMLGGCEDVTMEQLYGAQTLYEKVLGGWSQELEDILSWLTDGGDMPTAAIQREGFQVQYAQVWPKLYNLVSNGRKLDLGININPLAVTEDVDLMETAWVAFQLFRSAKVPKLAQIKVDNDHHFAGYMLKRAYSISEYTEQPDPSVNSEKKIDPKLFEGLTAEQAKLLHWVLDDGLSVDLNGRAGTGKTFAIQRLITAAKQMGYRVLIGAPTGQAAMLYENGTTCARLFGYNADAASIEIGSSQFKQLATDLRMKFAGKVLLIVDEKSMISSSELRLAYELVKAARNGQPCQWVLAGDYGQFPPVTGDYAFKSCTRHGVEYPPVVEEMGAAVLNLTQVMRQSDALFQEALDWAYWGIAIHPTIKSRLTPAPESADRYYYNNKNVLAENQRYVEEFLASHPTAEKRTYHAQTVNISQADLKLLLPVTPEMTLAVGMTFTVTKNTASGEYIKAANGEQVTIVGLRPNAIEVEKANGTRVILERVDHNLLEEEQGNKQFLQLPGYVGPALSLYKCQGKTLDQPSVFELWQEFNNRRTSLRLANALYVACSRVTKLEHLYLGGSIKLLYGCFGANPDVVHYLLGGRRPLWSTDPARSSFVIKLLGKQDDWYLFREFSIQTGDSTDIQVRCTGKTITEAKTLQDDVWLPLDPQELNEDYQYLLEVYEQDYQYLIKEL